MPIDPPRKANAAQPPVAKPSKPALVGPPPAVSSFVSGPKGPDHLDRLGGTEPSAPQPVRRPAQAPSAANIQAAERALAAALDTLPPDLRQAFISTAAHATANPAAFRAVLAKLPPPVAQAVKAAAAARAPQRPAAVGALAWPQAIRA